jgi:hypothetical protein
MVKVAYFNPPRKGFGLHKCGSYPSSKISERGGSTTTAAETTTTHTTKNEQTTFFLTDRIF